MSNSGNSSVMTVTGPVRPDELGVTLTHEHLFLDLQPGYAVQPETEEERKIAEGPVTIELLGKMRRNFGFVWDALILDDPAVILEAVSEFRELGGNTIVDVTPKGIEVAPPGFSQNALVDLSRKSGLNIVVGCGYYVQATHPPEVADRTVDDLTEEFLKEIHDGIHGTEVRPGVIGEIGMFQPIHPDEWKVLEAACRAQKATGMPLTIHPHFGTRSRVAPEIARFVLAQGVDPARVNMSHMDGYMSLEYQRRVADMGVYISFDTFGLEVYYDSALYNQNTHDSHREELLIQLLELGYQDQIMLSHDVSNKPMLTPYGGFGYGHILRDIVPSLRYEGVSEEIIDQLLIENPKRWLATDTEIMGSEREVTLADVGQADV